MVNIDVSMGLWCELHHVFFLERAIGSPDQDSLNLSLSKYAGKISSYYQYY